MGEMIKAGYGKWVQKQTGERTVRTRKTGGQLRDKGGNRGKRKTGGINKGTGDGGEPEGVRIRETNGIKGKRSEQE